MDPQECSRQGRLASSIAKCILPLTFQSILVANNVRQTLSFDSYAAIESGSGDAAAVGPQMRWSRYVMP